MQTGADGEFAVVLPYGEYLFAVGASGVSLVVRPLETTHLDLLIDASGVLREEVRGRSPGVWSAAARIAAFPKPPRCKASC